MPDQIDESVAPEPHGRSLRSLHEKHFGVKDFDQLRKRQEFEKLAEAARNLQRTRPDLIRQGPNPTIDLDTLPPAKRAAWRCWWGEGSIRSTSKEEQCPEGRIKAEIQWIEKNTGQSYSWGRGRPKKSWVDK